MEQLISGMKVAAIWGIGIGVVGAFTLRDRTKLAIDLLRWSKEHDAVK